MADDRYDRITFRGVTVDKYTRAALLAVEKVLGYELTLWQGSYHKGVSKSAGTHDGGGVVDLAGDYQPKPKVIAMRDHGFVGDWRTQPSLSGEVHCVQIGNTKVSKSAKAQIAPMERGRAGLAVDVPQVVKYTPPGGYKAFVYEVEPPYTKPVPKGDLFTLGAYNHALYNHKGLVTYPVRRAEMVANVSNAHLDVLHAQETGFDELDWWDKSYGRLGLVRAKGGSDGRYIWYRDSLFTRVDSGVFELTPEFQKDDKQAAWAVLQLRATGELFFFCSFHLEEAVGATADEIRPKQMESAYEQGAKVCAPHSIPTARRFFAGDTNSTTIVKDQMWKAHRFVTASKNAVKAVNTAFATFTNWIKKVKGAHVDYIFVDYRVPVTKWNQTVSSASDHNLVYATIGRR